MSTPVEDAPLPEPPLPETPYESPRKLAVIFFFLFLLLTSPVFLALSDTATPAATPVTPPDAPNAPSLRVDSFAQTLLLLFYGLVLSGVVLSAASALHYFKASPKLAAIRFLSAPWRPVPCLRMTDGLAAFFLFIAAYILLFATFASIGPDKIKASLSAGQMILLNTMIGVSIIAVPTVFLILRAKTSGGVDGAAGLWPFWKSAVPEPQPLWNDIKLGLKGYLYTAWFMIVLAILNTLVVSFFSGHQPTQNPIIDELKKGSNSPESALILPVLFILTALGAPIMEELLFRGGMYNILARPFGRIGSAIITSTLFALAHHVPSNTWPLFFMSISFIWLYEKTGRLVAPMVMHAANNLVVTVLTVVAGPAFQG